MNSCPLRRNGFEYAPTASAVLWIFQGPVVVPEAFIHFGTVCNPLNVWSLRTCKHMTHAVPSYSSFLSVLAQGGGLTLFGPF